MVGGNILVQQGGWGGMGALAGLAGQTGSTGANALAGLTGGLNPYVSVGYQRVGITLKLTPQINESDQVRLEIELEVSEVTGESELGPIIGQKTARTTSVVRDQQTVVIGGLMTDSEVETVEKIPFLGDIPVIGYLFRHTRTRITKRNLLIFLTPYIIRDPADFRRIFNRRMQERSEFMEQISAFRDREWEPDLDFSRTNGLFEEINRTLRDMEEEEALRRQLEQVPPPEHRPSEPISGAAFRTLGESDTLEIGPGEPPAPGPVVGRPITAAPQTIRPVTPGIR
jgi:general secretion pathway protein D